MPFKGLGDRTRPISRWWTLCAAIAVLLTGCLSQKQESQTAITDAANEPSAAAAPAEPVPPAAEPADPAPEEAEAALETVEPVAEETAPEPEPEPESPPPVFAPEPQDLLESALQACQSAVQDWKAGSMDNALEKLDQAYVLLLQIRDDESLDILQEKEELRYLISKRIVEIYASQRIAVGDVQKSIPIVINSYVEREIKSFQTVERRFFMESYVRSGRYRPMVLDILREEGLPEQLGWLPLIESGFKPSALSRARALGLWQFIPSTGYRYGLKRNQWVDERMDPEKATRAAVRYLQDLHGLFGDWMTAIAAYNCGEGRVLRAIKSQHINYLDNFWDLFQKLPYETARYVPRFLATLIILEDPAKYGFDLPDVADPEAFEVVEVSKSIQLSDLDRLADVPAGTFKSLNPELRHRVTLKDKYPLKIPVGAEETVRAGLDGLPAWQLPDDAYLIHRVRRGETLSTIARKYNSSVTRIVNANGMRNRHRIKPGQRLKIPGRGQPRLVLANDGRSQGNMYRVRKGDSLWEISQRFHVTVDQLRKWNGLRNNSLKVGQLLRVSAAEPVAAPQKSKIYYVRKGDTLDKIAKKHGVVLAALLKANNLSKWDTIFPNQQIVVPQRPE